MLFLFAFYFFFRKMSGTFQSRESSVTTPHKCLGIHGFGNTPFTYGGPGSRVCANDRDRCPGPSALPPGPLPDAGHCRPRKEGATALTLAWGPLSARQAPSQDGKADGHTLPPPEHVTKCQRRQELGAPIAAAQWVEGWLLLETGEGGLTVRPWGDPPRHRAATGSHTGLTRGQGRLGLPGEERGGRVGAQSWHQEPRRGAFRPAPRRGDAT